MANQKLAAGRRMSESTRFGKRLSREAEYLAGEPLTVGIGDGETRFDFFKEDFQDTVSYCLLMALL